MKHFIDPKIPAHTVSAHLRALADAIDAGEVTDVVAIPTGAKAGSNHEYQGYNVELLVEYHIARGNYWGDG